MQEYTKSQWLLGSLNGPNRQILLSQRNSSKTTRKNWLYVFFEQALITWVHWSCCVTLKALVLIFRTLMLLGGAHGRGPKPTTVFMKPWNCKQVKSTESKLCPQSHRVTVFSPQGLWRGRCIIAFQKGKNLGSIPFSACNTYFLCGLNGVEGDREKKKVVQNFLNILPRKVQVTHQKKRTFLSLSKSWSSGTAVGNSDHMMMRMLKVKKRERQITSGLITISGKSGFNIFMVEAMHIWHIKISFLAGVSE